VPVAAMSLSVAAFLMLLARPIGILLTLLPTPFRLREQLMIAWVGLRGAVPIILATFPLLAGLPQAEMIFNGVFFTVLTCALIQGTSLPLIAKWLGVDAPLTEIARSPLDFEPVVGMNSELMEIALQPNAAVAGKRIVDLGLPPRRLIVLLSRNNEFLIPRGGTMIEAGDKLLVPVDTGKLAVMQALFDAAAPSAPSEG
jgi:potassium/hydrogen antiporter